LGVVGALRAHRPVPATIQLDDRPAWTGPLTAAVVANGAYYGGGMMIAPAADPTDGCLDLTIIELRSSPDQSRQINHLAAGRGFGEGQALAHAWEERAAGTAWRLPRRRSTTLQSTSSLTRARRRGRSPGAEPRGSG
ncbi:MAG: diacylglycerol/lipid kinase family protein, partial [Candidatus Rokuibacteriota bacterium]